MPDSITPGSRLGIAISHNHPRHICVKTGEVYSNVLCGNDPYSVRIEPVNALDKERIIFNGDIIPLETNVECVDCKEIYKELMLPY